MSPLSEPKCSYGFPLSQLSDELDQETFNELTYWLHGQTMMLCDGRLYSHETGEYGETGHVCGLVAYRQDVERFMLGLPVVD